MTQTIPTLVDLIEATIDARDNPTKENQNRRDAIQREVLDSLASHIADGAVTTPKLADHAVTVTKLSSGAVTTPKLTDGAVTLAKVNIAGVTPEKFSP